MILLNDIAAGDVGLGSVLGSELFDVHAALATLDLLLQNVNPDVIALPEFPTSLIAEDLYQPGSGRVTADAIAQLIPQHVPDQGLVRVRPVEHPIRFLRQTEQCNFMRSVFLAFGLEMIAVLRMAQGRMTSHVDFTQTLKVRRTQQPAAASPGVHEPGCHRTGLSVWHLPAEGVQYHQW